MLRISSRYFFTDQQKFAEFIYTNGKVNAQYTISPGLIMVYAKRKSEIIKGEIYIELWPKAISSNFQDTHINIGAEYEDIEDDIITLEHKARELIKNTE